MSWFSIRGWFCFLGDIWQSMETFLVVTIGCLEEESANGRWVEARDAAKHSTMHRTVPTEKYSGTNMCIGLALRDSSFMEHDLITWKIPLCRPSQLLLLQEKEPTLYLACQAVYICLVPLINTMTISRDGWGSGHHSPFRDRRAGERKAKGCFQCWRDVLTPQLRLVPPATAL